MKFDPKELRSISLLCYFGEIPLAVSTVRRLCRIGKFPAIKQGNEWFTTYSAARHYFYTRANKSMRRISA